MRSSFRTPVLVLLACIQLFYTYPIFGSLTKADQYSGHYETTYKWLLPRRLRTRGILYVGSNERLRQKMSLLASGHNITITALGASITAGHGAGRTSNVWVDRLENLLQTNTRFKPGNKDKGNADRNAQPLEQTSRGSLGHVELVKCGLPGTMSTLASACAQAHVPNNTDIVIVEYAVNDPALDFITHTSLPIDHPARFSFERLLRKLLHYPHRPAVVLLNSYKWFNQYTTRLPDGSKLEVHGQYHKGGCEPDFATFAAYYGLPVLSLRACCHHRLAEGRAPGFWTNTTRRAQRQQLNITDNDEPPHLQLTAFYSDMTHPDGYTGHRVLAELAYHLLLTTLNDVAATPLSDDEQEALAQPLWEPMLPGNYEARDNRCLLNDDFKSVVTSSDPSWRWVDEAAQGGMPKLGYISSQPGARLMIKVNSRASVRSHKHDADEGNGDDVVAGDVRPADVLLQLAYLRSYENMGKAAVACVSGCSCAETEVDGHQAGSTSLLHLHTFAVSQSEQCVVSVTVRADSSSGGHKVKVMGLVVGEQPGARRGVSSTSALELLAGMAAGQQEQ